MATQNKVSSPVDETTVRPFRWSLALTILILGIFLAVLATDLSTNVVAAGPGTYTPPTRTPGPTNTPGPTKTPGPTNTPRPTMQNE